MDYFPILKTRWAASSVMNGDCELDRLILLVVAIDQMLTWFRIALLLDVDCFFVFLRCLLNSQYLFYMQSVLIQIYVILFWCCIWIALFSEMLKLFLDITFCRVWGCRCDIPLDCYTFSVVEGIYVFSLYRLGLCNVTQAFVNWKARLGDNKRSCLVSTMLPDLMIEICVQRILRY